MKKHPFATFLTGAWALVVLLALASPPGHASAITQGTYTGIYSGDDYGTVTVVVDSSGNVTCDFLSTPKFIHYHSSGTENPSSSSFLINCNSPGSAAYYWTAGSNPTSVPGNALNGFWGGNTGTGQLSGTFTAYFSSVSTDPAGSLNTASFVGLWYDPAFTSTGFNILPSSAGLLVTYYGVDANGKMLWLISDVGPKSIAVGSAITLNMRYSSKGTFQAPIRDLVLWGQLTLTFTNCSNATATLSGTDGTITENLALLAGAMGMPGCQ